MSMSNQTLYCDYKRVFRDRTNPIEIIATARVLPKATQRELFRLGAYLDTRNHITDNDIFPSSDFGPFWSILVYFGYYRSYVLAIHRDIHVKPPISNSLQ